MMTYGKRKSSAFRSFLKWLSGILLLVCFIITTGIYNLYVITSPDVAISTLSRILEKTVPTSHLENIDLLRSRAISSGKLSIQPIPGISITLDKDKIKDLPSVEFRQYIFHEAAQPLYMKGVDSYLVDVRDSSIKTALSSFGTQIYYLADDFHRFIRFFLITASIITTLLFITLFAMSYRFGKLVSTGIVLTFTGAAGVGLFTSIGTISSAIRLLPFSSTQGRHITEGVSQILSPLIDMIRFNYLLLLIAGGVFILTAFLGKWAYNIITGKNEGEE